jgi:hypothetical protein
VTIQRSVRHRVKRSVRVSWVSAADDLGMQLLWSTDANGNYVAHWEVPLTVPHGLYRFLITAKQYTLASQPFNVGNGAILTPQVSGQTVGLGYPQPYLLNDWTYRPAQAAGGRITFIVDGKRRVVRERSASAFPIPAGASVSTPAGGARDLYGNTNPSAIQVR